MGKRLVWFPIATEIQSPLVPREQTDSSGRAGSLWGGVKQAQLPSHSAWRSPVAQLPSTPCFLNPVGRGVAGEAGASAASPLPLLSQMGAAGDWDLHFLPREVLLKVKMSELKIPQRSSSPERQIGRLLFLFCFSVCTA